MRNFQNPGRSVVMSTHGMAATSHPAATQAAVRVLEAGGTAMDAAVAACAVQCVVEPGSTGIGGDCFALYSEKGSDRITAYNGAGWAPQATSLKAVLASGEEKQLRRQSPYVVTVPGAVDAWVALTERFGRLPMGRLLEDAIRFAEQGYAVAPRAGTDWAMHTQLLAATTARDIMLVDGQAPAIGSVHRQPQLGATLRKIAEQGRAGFYEGEVAQDIVSYLRSLGGVHTLEDFSTYRGEFVQPVKSRFRDHVVHECPPPGQGIIALLLLNILQGLEPGTDPLSPERLKAEIDATRMAYRVRDALLADPRFADVDVDYLLSQELAAQLRNGEFPEHFKTPATNAAAEHKDTVYISVVDKDRNCASFINSIFHPFGSGLMAPKSGVLLHNRGQSFELAESHPNCIGPGKRPLHTIIPGMTTKDGRVELVFGVMGGHYQAMGHAHFLSKVIDYGCDIQAASDLPRLFPIPGTDKVEVESTLPQHVAQALEQQGYQLVAPGYPAIGGAQAIRVDWDNGVLHGASDHRKDGCAMGANRS
ncbi:Gamma-glutamyltransferase [Delftia acidovorans SPH-1]|uniref:Gamma-glutamyltransferase n=2 Tax=Delftia acidovorans TaxID=80866 RepID=A9C2R6_DELAS|nr:MULTISPECIES: gamma-glutamyltransferase family protein [Delftia]MCP4018025.1 gamma-glutamyltransferase family protein [Delftia sp.]OLE95098.1 MAG: gamma-glutamyltransferase [Delftia sp. 13_1_40CM_3_66_6]ABX36415.1 Gamma-glutamyltransferase [Delftia acidovorans SPH-1]MCP4516013.1 gamma-glutamyltransferase family protein [Delftia sp.]MCP4531561.1 gamma-glutamyltransferase family protein [Delftia sp.]